MIGDEMLTEYLNQIVGNATKIVEGISDERVKVRARHRKTIESIDNRMWNLVHDIYGKKK